MLFVSLLAIVVAPAIASTPASAFLDSRNVLRGEVIANLTQGYADQPMIHTREEDGAWIVSVTHNPSQEGGAGEVCRCTRLVNLPRHSHVSRHCRRRRFILLSLKTRLFYAGGLYGDNAK